MVAAVGDDVRGAGVAFDHLARPEVEFPVTADEGRLAGQDADPRGAVVDLVAS